MSIIRLTPLLFLLACGGTADSDTTADVPSNEANRDGECTFNKDCPADQRCECDEATGCFCATGARGTGQNGVDTCTDGNDCASSLCIEGQGGAFYCSDECETDDDCGEALPTCTDIAFLGRVCIREASE
jgi:hypothetical protein